MQKIAATNGLLLDALRAGERVLSTTDRLNIPLSDGTYIEKLTIFPDGAIMTNPEKQKATSSLWGIAETYRAGMGYPEDTGAAFRALTEINGISAQKALSEGYAVKPYTEDPSGRHSYFIIPLKDDFAAVAPLPERRIVNHHPTDVIVMEFDISAIGSVLSGEEDHHENTTRVVQGVGKALEPSIENNHIWPVVEQFQSSMRSELDVADRDLKKGLRVAMRSDEAENGSIVFSYSMGTKYDGTEREETKFQQGNSPLYYKEQQTFWDRVDPITFVAAGNEYGQGRVYQNGQANFHGNRQLWLGAVGAYDDQPEAIGCDSNLGADLCAPMTHDQGVQYHGTSFAAPFMAGSYRVQSERYGQSDTLPEGLTFDEMIATAMLTARRDIFERNRRNKETVAGPATFTTNGGGLPYHPRCGAGLLDNHAWDAANTDMVMLKRERGVTSELIEEFVAAKPMPSKTASGYRYRLPVPQDMTLGRLTFYLPQTAEKRVRYQSKPHPATGKKCNNPRKGCPQLGAFY